MNDKQQNDIDRYIRGEMNTDEKKNFEREMLSNHQLKQEVELTSAIRRNLGATARKKRLMKQWDARRKPAVKIASKWWLRTTIGIAACFVFCFVVYDKFFMDSTNDVSSMGYTTDPKTQGALQDWQVRGGLASDEIVRLVEKGDYDKALSAIESAEADTAIEVGVPVDEREYLQEVRADEKYRLTWLKIIALNGLGRVEEAHRLLTEFVALNGEFQEKAKQMLNEMNEKK